MIMQMSRISVLLLALSLLYMPTYAVVKAAIGAFSQQHDCHGQQPKQSDERIHLCCEQQVIPVASFQLEPGNIAVAVLSDVEATREADSFPIPRLTARDCLRTSDIPARLSVLRI